MIEALEGLRLLLGQVPPRRRLMIGTIFFMWTNTAIVVALYTYQQIAHNRASEVVFVAGNALSLVRLWWVGRRYIRLVMRDAMRKTHVRQANNHNLGHARS